MKERHLERCIIYYLRKKEKKNYDVLVTISVWEESKILFIIYKMNYIFLLEPHVQGHHYNS